jgi:hypothetical protein
MTVAKRVAKKTTPGVPQIKQKYGGFHTWDLRYGKKKQLPKRGSTQMIKSGVSFGTISKLTKNVNDFAENAGVDPDLVRIYVDYRGLELRVNRPETDEEFDARVKHVERWNKALADYKVDSDIVENYYKDERLAAENKIKDTVRTELKSDIKAKLRNDAKLLAVLTDEVLSDEKFIKQLKALFTKGL